MTLNTLEGVKVGDILAMDDGWVENRVRLRKVVEVTKTRVTVQYKTKTQVRIKDGLEIGTGDSCFHRIYWRFATDKDKQQSEKQHLLYVLSIQGFSHLPNDKLREIIVICESTARKEKTNGQDKRS